ncbi:hypothetical protein B0H16DRAFT_1877035 [Mycena metata]|uniref:F-box domain-containing protein n=1 Tax=Mycena metata TaxID=1033252 RepID=A0AAD7KFL5_9AGAR|nr:hypothetical protein B0H16DRAFT_1877035 [Mycena metata]
MVQFCLTCGAASPPLNPPLPPPDSSLNITHLLKSNDAPLDSQIPLVRECISNEQNQVAALDAHIESLDAHIKSLNAQIKSVKSSLAEVAKKRVAAKKRIRQHHAVLATVRRMPPELLCEIFAWTLLDASANAAKAKPPWYLGHVCQSWRHAAVSHPALWASIVIDCAMPTDDTLLLPAKAIRLLSRTEVQLLRSGDVDLDIRLLNVGSNVNPRIVDMVLPHCRRWRSLTFSVQRNTECALHWLRPVDGRLDRLETLRLVDAEKAVIPDIFSTAPNLRKVFLNNWQFSRHSPTIVIPWGQITHYHGYDTLERQLNILRSAPNLVECAVSSRHNFNDEDPPHGNQIVLPCLHRLRMEPADTLAHITAPSVQEVSLRLFNPLAPLLLPSIQRSSCTITKLVVQSTITASDLVSALKGLPLLSYLLLENRDYSRTDSPEYVSLFRAMASADICPNLTSFVYGFRFKATNSKYLDSLFKMVRSRFGPNLNYPHHPGYVRIFHRAEDYSLPSSARSQIRKLRAEGFDIAFLNPQQTASLRETLY